jgi:hypothetical protein
MKNTLLVLVALLAIGSTASAQWIAPEVVTTYYGGPVYAASEPYVAPAPYIAPAPVVYSTYYAPSVVVASPRVAYMPISPVVAAPAPVVYGRPAIVRTKVYYPYQPIRNTVRYVLP